MAIYPSQLTTEEKNLKKRYARLQEKRKLLRRLLEKPSQATTSGAKQQQKEILSPKDAKAAAKRLLETGKLTIKSKTAPKRSGFKRVGEKPGETPPAKKANIEQTPAKPKIKASDVKELYSRFVKPTNPEDLERIPKKLETPETLQKIEEVRTKSVTTKECTVFVHCPGMSEEALRIAFSRFGEVQTLTMEASKSTSFITFNNPSIASTAKKEMHNGMIRGSDVHVDFASDENGYVELPPEAASNPWAQLAAGRELTGSPAKRQRHKEIVSYEPDF